jgi:hypothetical protein
MNQLVIPQGRLRLNGVDYPVTDVRITLGGGTTFRRTALPPAPPVADDGEVIELQWHLNGFAGRARRQIPKG